MIRLKVYLLILAAFTLSVMALSGKVTDGLGAPIQGVKIALIEDASTTLSGVNGEFILTPKNVGIHTEKSKGIKVQLRDDVLLFNNISDSKVAIRTLNLHGVEVSSFKGQGRKNQIILYSIFGNKSISTGLYVIQYQFGNEAGTIRVAASKKGWVMSAIDGIQTVLKKTAEGALDSLSFTKTGYVTKKIAIMDYTKNLGTIVMDMEEPLPENDFYRLTLLDSDTLMPNFVRLLFQAQDSLAKGVTGLGDCYNRQLCQIEVNGSALTSEQKVYVEKTQSFRDTMKTVLLIDNSSSIGTDLPVIKAAANKFIAKRSKNQVIAIYSFASGVVLEQEFTSDTTALKAAVDAIPVGPSSTNLYGALVTGLGRISNQVSLANSLVIRGNLIVFTDGKDTQGSSTLSAVQSAQGSGDHKKEIYAVGYGSEFDKGSLTTISDGNVYIASDAAGLATKFEEIRQDLLRSAGSYYYLYYSAPQRGYTSHNLKLFIKNNVNKGSDAIVETTFNSSLFVDGYPCIAKDLKLAMNSSQTGLDLSYSFNDVDGDVEGITSIDWYQSTSATGSWTKINADTDTTLKSFTTTLTTGYRFMAVVQPRQKRNSPELGLLDSVIFTIEQVATPTISQASGTYNDTMSVTLTSATTNAKIYYTTDNSIPTKASTFYTGSISVNTSQTIRAIAVKDGMKSSAEKAATYSLVASVPVFSLAAGTYNDAQTLTLTSATPDADIYYTTDGTDPTTTSNKYTDGITLEASQTIKAIASKTGLVSSSVESKVYTLVVNSPMFTAVDGPGKDYKIIVLNSATPSALIYYTTDGTDPTSASALYTTPISIDLMNGTKTLKAIALKDGWTNSTITSATYNFVIN